ncbi:MAG: glycerol-3-phosphate dehydrogenase [Pelagibacteraceae bacterium BACL20 MAG-120920-bin64]|jgi:glycerol-3-phosphate dehydrogenase (NAD(P)+)|uniref:2-dehydropantoate 2-reductase N-terminal domain-containing protein n=1 Tax=Candidatus Pelagibacter sp. TaxID=2024849 RepID=UPI0007160F35|nr:MAG: glycerol-3-phosphate dehydrogenase [Pelagibacteraceae bacterium BACL20 MAG-120920-bin64]
MKKIIIVGAGAMGSAFAVPCLENKNDVTLIGTHLEDDLINNIKSNKNFHPALNLELPSQLKVEKFEKLSSILDGGVDIIVAGVSSIGIEWFVEQISKNYKKNLPIILLTKGLAIEENELITLSDKIKKLLGEKGHTKVNVSAIKGPCLAAGLANKMRTGTVIANPDIKETELLKKIISTNYYSTEITDDLTGVELSGAIKNIYSMLIGASEGLSNSKAPKEIQSKYYLNTSASLIHRSISEMVEFVSHYGGKAETVYGLAGLGDLYVSAIGGRNSLMGKYLGEGYLYKEAKEKFMKNVTVEGAQLALEIGPKILKDLNPKYFPLMFSMLNTICKNEKLEINW